MLLIGVHSGVRGRGPYPPPGRGSAKAGTCLALEALFAIVVVVIMVVTVVLRGGQGRGGEKAHQQHCRQNLGGVHRGLLQGTQHVHTIQVEMM